MQRTLMYTHGAELCTELVSLISVCVDEAALSKELLNIYFIALCTHTLEPSGLNKFKTSLLQNFFMST